MYWTTSDIWKLVTNGQAVVLNPPLSAQSRFDLAGLNYVPRLRAEYEGAPERLGLRDKRADGA